MDAGYPSTKSLLALRTEHQVRLIGPMRGDSSRHAREGSPYARDKFTVDFDRQQVTCPRGNRSATWNPARQDGQDVIVVSFPLGACIVCLARTDCTRSQQRRRQLTLRPRHLHEALRDARAEQRTDAWKQTYRARAGIEGTIHQVTAVTAVTGIRQAGYIGLGKVSLEHMMMSAPAPRVAQPPPVAGSRSTAMWGSPASRVRASWRATLCSCVSAGVPSCIRLPPVAINDTTGTAS